MNKVAITPPPGPVDGAIRPPGSKSITNRAIVCAALADGQSVLRGVLESEDTEVMITAWQHQGVRMHHDRAAHVLRVDGCGGRLPVAHEELFLANSGTSIRFLTAALAACGGNFLLDGVPRMRERPIGDLLAALRQLGADVSSQNAAHPDCPPVHIRSQGLRGGTACVSGSISSQFLSGIMMAAPLAKGPVQLHVDGELVSVPYVRMTSAVMEAFNVHVEGPPEGPMHIAAPQSYAGIDYSIEPDASAASYFWGAAAITGGRARVEGLSKKSLQGDVAFCEVLEAMGCDVDYGDNYVEVVGRPLHGVDVDMAPISDTVQTLAAVALFAKGDTTVRGVAHNRVKETDRISDLARELRKMAAQVEEFPDGLKITPPGEIRPARIATYQDHRMAMSLALVGLKIPGIEIDDPDCTGKTYPRYWEDLAAFANCRIERFDDSPSK